MHEQINLIQVFEYFADQQKCTDLLVQVRWGNGVKCPFCKCMKIYYLNGKNKRFKCAKCLKQFSLIKGTIFENSPISLQKWFTAIYLLLADKKGISSIQLAKSIQVTQSTAWFMLQRIRFMLRNRMTKTKLKGLIQIDETFVGGKNKNRRWDKKVKYSQGRSFKDKTPVLGMLDDSGNIKTIVISDTKASTIQPIVRKMIDRNSIIVTDEWKAYRGLENEYTHFVVDHGRSQYVNENGFTTNSLEGAWSHLKRMIIGVYHKVSRKHLQRYCDEFAFRYNTRNVTDSQRFKLALMQVESRLRYKDVVTKVVT